MGKSLTFLLALAVLVLQGCTTAGPFVTNISADNRGGLYVEKCTVHLNAFLGTVSNQNCTQFQINLPTGKD